MMEAPAIAEGFDNDDDVVEKSLARLATVELGDNGPDADIPVGDTLVADDLTEDESIGPEPAREDDVDSARERCECGRRDQSKETEREN